MKTTQQKKQIIFSDLNLAIRTFITNQELDNQFLELEKGFLNEMPKPYTTNDFRFAGMQALVKMANEKVF